MAACVAFFNLYITYKSYIYNYCTKYTSIVTKMYIVYIYIYMVVIVACDITIYVYYIHIYAV